ncbi:MAG: hypothetical protein ABS35_44925 [Kaistia sp. SCN 65-12]|nr:heavy-metal-associated domain-containing protein [Hyphomicrobiales bacterium]ODT07484.1 MAG: hypothetical protein ABS35_44925 [Kaistia sp. SCN 65-12]
MTAHRNPDVTVTLVVPGMVCDGCAEKIRGALTRIPGVHNVRTKLWQKQVQVTFEKEAVSENAIVHVLSQQGFDAAAA